MRVGTIKRWVVGLWPFCRVVWYRLPTAAGHVVALTFDDGPHPVYTPQVLDILKAGKAKGCFFLLGNACRRYPELVERIRTEGHAIGIHGMDHSPHRMVRQVEECRCLLLEMGVDTRLFRPPRGRLAFPVFLRLALRGYRII